MAANDLCTLQDVKAWLGLSSAQITDDALLSGAITAASSFIQTQCARDFYLNSYTETRDGNGGRRMPFTQFPVQAVTSVSIDGVPVPLGDANQHVGYYFTEKMLLLNGYAFTRNFGNVAFSYQAGWAAIPQDVVQAAIDLVAWWYKKKDRADLASKVMGGETTSFVIKDVPSQVASTIAARKRVGLQ